MDSPILSRLVTYADEVSIMCVVLPRILSQCSTSTGVAQRLRGVDARMFALSPRVSTSADSQMLKKYDSPSTSGTCLLSKRDTYLDSFLGWFSRTLLLCGCFHSGRRELAVLPNATAASFRCTLWI